MITRFLAACVASILVASAAVAYDPKFGAIAPDMDANYSDDDHPVAPNLLVDASGKSDQLKVIICEVEHEERCFGPMSWWQGQQVWVAYQDAGMTFLLEGDGYYAAALEEGTLSYEDAWKGAPDGDLPVAAVE